MARRPQPPTPEPAKLSVESMRKGIKILERRLAELDSFDPASASDDAVSALEKSIDDSLERVFGKDTTDYLRYASARLLDNGPYTIATDWGRAPPRDTVRYLTEGKASSTSTIRQAVKALAERIEDEGDEMPTPIRAGRAVAVDPNHIFIVHGRDEATKYEVAHFIKGLGLEPTILDEQANKGRTLLEKFEDHSNVGYAIVLLTPDDEGALRGDALAPRARQNVIMELGFFVGKLGRSRVTALTRGQLDLPTDFGGFATTAYEKNWKFDLVRELKAAGYAVG